MKKLVFFVLIAVSQLNFAETKILDLLYLNENISFKEVRQYFKDVNRIASRYGMKQVELYQVTKAMKKGPPSGVNGVGVWAVKDPSKIKGLFTDEDYKKVIPRRNRIFDMSKSTPLMMK